MIYNEKILNTLLGSSKKNNYLEIAQELNIPFKSIDKIRKILITRNSEEITSAIRTIYFNRINIEEKLHILKLLPEIVDVEKDWPCAIGQLEQRVMNLMKLINKNNIREILEQWGNDAEAYLIRRSIRYVLASVIEYYFVLFDRTIVPTLVNRKGVDFYYRGLPFDEKTVRYSSNLPNNDRALAKQLYSKQGEKRFNNDNRIFVVISPKDEINFEKIKESIKKFVKLDNPPIKISYIYKGVSYENLCYVIRI